MFGMSKRERAEAEISEITAQVLGRSIVHGSEFPPYGVFETHMQMMVALEACGFFLHAVDRLAYRENDQLLREMVFDAAASQMVRTFSDMIFEAWAPSPLPKIEHDNLNLFNVRQAEYGNASKLVGKTFNDLKSASWLAAHNVARAAEFTAPDIRILAIHTELVQSLVIMDLANRIKKVESYIG